MKKSLLASTLLTGLVVLSACTSATTPTDQDDAMSVPSDSMDDSSSSSAASEMSDTSEASEGTTTDARIIEMSVKDWEFSPNAITAKIGEKVIVRLTDNEGIHSFASNDLGLNVRINPGETKDIVIDTSKAGTFSFKCGVPCGPGHKEMIGTIVIE